MVLSIKVSGIVIQKEDKKNPYNDGRAYITPINKRGMEEIAVFEGTQEQIEKQVRDFLRGCTVHPSSRKDRFIAFAGKDCHFLTLESYKTLAPYLRKFNYLE